MTSQENTSSPARDDTWVPSACEMCYSSCGIRVHRVNGVITRIEGRPDFPHNWGRLCAKGNAGIMNLYDPNRVKAPLRRTNPEKGIGVDPKWMEIGWEEALDTIADRLRQTRSKDRTRLALASFDGNSRALAGIWAAAFGTPSTSWCGALYYCGAALHMATYLTNASFHMGIDLDRCNYAMLFGSQMGFGIGHGPNLATQKMADARVRGMHLVVVDPVCSYAASKAQEWVPIRPGTDGALALAMLNVLLNELGTYDAEFIKVHTNGPYLVGADGHYVRDEESRKPLVWDPSLGAARPYNTLGTQSAAIEGEFTVRGQTCRPAFQRLKDHVSRYSPDEASKTTTVPAATIRRLAKEYGEAARIGATITMEGETLPYRPAAVHQYRGAYSHKHATQHILAIQLLNIVIGNIYAPGGHYGINPIGPWWEWKEGVDGLLVASEEVQVGEPPYHFLETAPGTPKTAQLETLFPISRMRDTALHAATADPEKFGVQAPEVLIHCRTNLMMTTVAPEAVAKALKNIPFMVSFARELDETVQFADIVLPDFHYLEKLDPIPNATFFGQSPSSGYWYWGLRQPAVRPPFEAKQWVDVLTDLADRVGFREDLNVLLSKALSVRCRNPIKLDRNKKYTLEELSDIWLKAEAGDDAKGLAWFREHGQLTIERTVAEHFPILALRHRIPLYYEHFLTAGDYVQKSAQAMGLAWDTSDYQPMPDWKPCPAFEPKAPDYDLLVVNYTVPFHQYSITAENPWLNEVSERHPYVYKIMVNTETARRKGIRDGAAIVVETPAGRKVTGQAKVTECIHPEVVAIAGVFGAWSSAKPIARGKGAHFNSLIPFDLDHTDMISASADSCERVRVRPVKPA